MATMTALRQRFAREMRAFYSGTFTSGSTTTGIQNTWPIKDARVAKNDAYEGWHLLRPAAAAAGDRVRQIAAGDYAPSTGTFTLDTYTNTAGTEAFELHGHMFEPWTQMQDLANQALKRIPLVVTFPFTPSQSAYDHDLTMTSAISSEPQGQSWLTNEYAVRQVSFLSESGHQQQTITQSGSPTGGTFNISYRGTQSSAVAYNCAAATLETALRLMPYLDGVTVTRTGTTTNFVWTVTMQDVVGPFPLLFMDPAFNSMTGGSSPTLTFAESRQRGTPQMLRGSIRKDGAHVIIEPQFRSRYNQGTTTGDRLYITAIKPAYYHCRASSSGVFGDQSGLSAEAHECEPEIEYVVAAMCVDAWHLYPNQMAEAVSGRQEQSEQECWVRFKRYMGENYRTPDRTFRPLIQV